MNRLVILFLALASFSCNNKQQKTATVKASDLAENLTPSRVIEGPVLNNEPYTIELQLDKIDNKSFNLKVLVKLNNGSYYVSPHSKIAYKGRFTMSVKDHENLHFVGDILETPRSVEVYDPHPFVRGPVNWVRKNTSYTQEVIVKKNKDFEVMGHLQFTIEPKCTLERVPFIIKYKDGEMKFEIFKC